MLESVYSTICILLKRISPTNTLRQSAASRDSGLLWRPDQWCLDRGRKPDKHHQPVASRVRLNRVDQPVVGELDVARGINGHARVPHQCVAVVAIGRDRLTRAISWRTVLRLRAAELGDPLTAEVSDPDIIVAIYRDSPRDHDSAALVWLCTNWDPVGIELCDGSAVRRSERAVFDWRLLTPSGILI